VQERPVRHATLVVERSYDASPARMDYGGIDAVFDDTCGNLVNLHQD
jgi:hypothetical protein